MILNNFVSIISKKNKKLLDFVSLYTYDFFSEKFDSSSNNPDKHCIETVKIFWNYLKAPYRSLS